MAEIQGGYSRHQAQSIKVMRALHRRMAASTTPLSRKRHKKQKTRPNDVLSIEWHRTEKRYTHKQIPIQFMQDVTGTTTSPICVRGVDCDDAPTYEIDVSRKLLQELAIDSITLHTGSWCHVTTWSWTYINLKPERGHVAQDHLFVWDWTLQTA